MTTTEIVLSIVAWLALQIPIGVVVGWYIRRARTLMAEPIRAACHAPRGQRHFARYTPRALLRG